MPSRIVALLTDFGLRDPFVGTMKGVMLGINPELQLIDISHEISPQRIREAAIVLAASWAYFPPHTIFLVVVDPGVGGTRRPIIVETTDRLFVAPDNGVLAPALDQAEVRRVIHATERRYFRQPISRTFHGRDVFAPLAAWLSCGVQAQDMGATVDEYQRLDIPQPWVEADDELAGEVIYQDRFGNLITNIAEAWAMEVWGASPWQGLEVAIDATVIRGLDSHYAQRPPQELGIIINSWGLFEVFANGGSAAQATGVVEGSPVRIRRSAP
jgi:S-adenosyl-L-methionine hydrolase (adenosine-forming)